jgi:hypothetical protein
MRKATRRAPRSTRNGERITWHAPLVLHDAQDHPLALEAETRDIGLGGVRVVAARALAPGTRVRLALRLASGRLFESRGHVAWARTTLHPCLLGSPKGIRDDALFGVAFDGLSTEALLPIARLLVARQDQKRRVRRIQRLHGLPIFA